MIRRLFAKFYNRGSQPLSDELSKTTLPCDGCGRMPLVNPKWLINGNSWFKEGQKILGCPSATWGLARGWDAIEEAVDNWNHHVKDYGDHHCEG